MRIGRVVTLSPMDRMAYWIEERESIRAAKESNEKPPWTDDKILHSFRFCNVRRMDDKVSQWLLNNWYKPYFNHRNMLIACALARFINKPESLQLITEQVFRDGVQWERIKRILREYRDAGNVVFNGAYMVRGNDGIDKIECVVEYYVRPLSEHPNNWFTGESMEYAWGCLYDCYGFGSFMAGQVVADLRHAKEGRWADKHVWAPMGPGSKRGMNRLHARPPNAPLGQLQFVEELMEMQSELRTRLPAGITNRLEAIDWQNCLCEYDKYSRALFDEGKPKQLYRPEMVS